MKKRLKLFFSGIGGSGVSAIASFMADKGHTVVGSDRAFDRNPGHPMYTLLRSKHITVVPQDGNGIDATFDLAVFSTAVEPDQPEIVKAKALGVPLKTRPEYLAQIVTDFRTIAVAGTSGKSTTAGMLAFLMHRLGMQPNFIGGGRVKQFKQEGNPGNAITGDSDWLVIEACESDGTIVNYKPVHSVILNLDFDHHVIDETAGMFETLAKNTSGMLVVNADDKNLSRLGFKEAVTFSVDVSSRYRAEMIQYNPLGTEFMLQGTKFCLSLPGKYNLSNALSCVTALAEMGVPLGDIAHVLPEFSGIERRFDIHLSNGQGLVIDDYAHNPHKIASFMQSMQMLRRHICYIFQPHGFAPTRMMKKEYIEAFVQNLRDSDHLILLPIYYAGGTVSKDISSHDLAEGVRAAGKSVEVIEERETILRRVEAGENYVVLGARDETLADFAEALARRLNDR
ncbi:MAG: Mur ligase domain-containing protein [Nitrospirota bacterium]